MTTISLPEVDAMELIGNHGRKMLAALGFLSLFVIYNSPAEVKIFTITAWAGGLLLYGPVKRLVNWLYSPAWIYLLVIQAEEEGVRLYRFLPENFDQITVEEGELEHHETCRGPLYVARLFDEEEMVASGTWRASVSDLELIRRWEVIKDTREELEGMAQEGIAIRSKAPTAIRGAVREIVQDIACTIEKGSIPSGEKIDDAFEKAVGDFELQEPGETGSSSSEPGDNEDKTAEEAERSALDE